MQPNPFATRIEFCRKLGIKAGDTIVLLDAPSFIRGMRYSLFPLADIEILDDLSGADSPDIVIFWASDSLDLAKAFELLRKRTKPEGAIWAVIPTKPIADARGPKVYMDDLVAAARLSNLVDNKTLTFSQDESGIRFVPRREPPKVVKPWE